jgi:hypothetical protein
MQMKTLMGAGLAGALLLGTAGAAWAGVAPETQTQTYKSGTNWSTTLTFSAPTVPYGYTLSQVSIAASENLNGTVTISNPSTAASDTSGFVSQEDNLTLTFPSPISSEALINQATQQNVVNLAPGTSHKYDFLNTVTDTYNYTSGLSVFDTTWNLGLGDVDHVITSLSGGSPSALSVNTGTATVDVTYYFTPTATVAEPFSVAMLASGLLSLAMVRRRRRS